MEVTLIQVIKTLKTRCKKSLLKLQKDTCTQNVKAITMHVVAQTNRILEASQYLRQKILLQVKTLPWYRVETE